MDERNPQAVRQIVLVQTRAGGLAPFRYEYQQAVEKTVPLKPVSGELSPVQDMIVFPHHPLRPRCSR